MPESQRSGAKTLSQTRSPGFLPRITAPPSAAKPPPEWPVEAKEPPKENVKETIESILVAFILAFVFRAFVVEAFVIPSGSMAPTLLGAHMRFDCEECGYPFDVNFPSQDRGGDDISIPHVAPAVFSMHCPNCGFKVLRGGRDAASSPSIPVYYGDRILVLKYLYLLQEPSRWDIVVFKSPSEAGRYTQNFIKRLVGKPGESIMVLDGDVYVCPNEKATAKAGRGSRGVGRGGLCRGGGGGRGFENATGGARFEFDKDANKDRSFGAFPLADWLPYNETMNVRLPDRLPEVGAYNDSYNVDLYAREMIPRWYVSDLKLEFSYRRNSGDGAMSASLTKLGHRFTAELRPGKARLVHRLPDGTTVTVGEAGIGTEGDLNVEFTNVDYQVTLRINGRDLIRTTPADYRPDVKQLLQLHQQQERLGETIANYEQIRAVFGASRAELAAELQSCQVTHLSLWRDIYYTPGSGYGKVGEIRNASPENPVRLSARGEVIAGNKMENEYFVLGDNSILSSDARYWTQPVNLVEGEDLYADSGRVPERFMLGKAFFVYWPAGFRPFTTGAPGVIPNFGDMRFIH
ncbi:MAG: S26 family signal peptidase [Planctomycetota bacterium]|nr:S26 family signal peptidase [Planctomycetota bacterium]